MRIVLASGSPRRRELLEQIGWEFEQCVSEVEEVMEGDSPEQVVEALSRQKAEAVFDLMKEQEEVLVIGADTVVEMDGRILGKPADRDAAADMLKRLQGREHRVYTGVTLCCRRRAADGWTESVRSFHEATAVRFFEMSPEEIEAYVDSGEPMDKAGAYGIQGLAARYVKGIEGDYNNVVGLPVGRLYQEVMRVLRGECPA